MARLEVGLYITPYTYDMGLARQLNARFNQDEHFDDAARLESP